MDIIKEHLYTEQEFENIQNNFNGKCEYDNGSIFLSSNTYKTPHPTPSFRFPNFFLPVFFRALPTAYKVPRRGVE